MSTLWNTKKRCYFVRSPHTEANKCVKRDKEICGNVEETQTVYMYLLV